MHKELRSTVFEFVNMIQPLSEPDLEITWKWKGYNEGIRFANFRVYEELRQLAVNLRAERIKNGNPASIAQNILAQHHQAYFDLLALLQGVDEDTFDFKQNENEWSVRNTLQHSIEGEWSFLMAVETGIKRIRNNEEQQKFTRENWTQHFEERGGFTDAYFEKPLEEILTLFERLHHEVGEIFSDIKNDELAQKVIFWEEELLPIQFRIHRFDAHLRQHSIQAEKILLAAGHDFSEARVLGRRILNALAEVEGTQFGNKEMNNEIISATRNYIESLKIEIQKLLRN